MPPSPDVCRSPYVRLAVALPCRRLLRAAAHVGDNGMLTGRPKYGMLKSAGRISVEVAADRLVRLSECV